MKTGVKVAIAVSVLLFLILGGVGFLGWKAMEEIKKVNTTIVNNVKTASATAQSLVLAEAQSTELKKWNEDMDVYTASKNISMITTEHDFFWILLNHISRNSGVMSTVSIVKQAPPKAVKAPASSSRNRKTPAAATAPALPVVARLGIKVNFTIQYYNLFSLIEDLKTTKGIYIKLSGLVVTPLNIDEGIVSVQLSCESQIS